jgi:hypothetical protein
LLREHGGYSDEEIADLLQIGVVRQRPGEEPT